MTRPLTYGTLLHRLMLKGGFTAYVRGVSPVELLDSGFTVSVDPEFEEVWPSDISATTALGIMVTYVTRHRGILASPDKYFGAWLDKETERLYLDVSTVLDDREKAIELAEKFNQLAVYDLSDGQEIRVREA